MGQWRIRLAASPEQALAAPRFPGCVSLSSLPQDTEPDLLHSGLRLDGNGGLAGSRFDFGKDVDQTGCQNATSYQRQWCFRYNRQDGYEAKIAGKAKCRGGKEYQLGKCLISHWKCPNLEPVLILRHGALGMVKSARNRPLNRRHRSLSVVSGPANARAKEAGRSRPDSPILSTVGMTPTRSVSSTQHLSRQSVLLS